LLRCARMQANDCSKASPPAQGGEGVHQLRKLLAQVEQTLPDQESAATATPPPVILGVDRGCFQLRLLPDRRTETLSMLPYRERRAAGRGDVTRAFVAKRKP
jgi:hypothetical protein